MNKPKDQIYCISWNVVNKAGYHGVIKQAGYSPEGKDHTIIDFSQPLMMQPSVENQTLFAFFQQVANSGFRYLMVYSD